MTLWKEVAFATALTLASILTMPEASAHEIKAGNLVITHPWMRQSPSASDAAAGFMKITNTGTEDDRLLSATSDLTLVVQLHEMKMEGDVMKMKEIAGGIPLPAGATVELKPGGLHVMFMSVKSQPMEGTEVTGTLVFEKAGTVEIDYEVMAPDAGMDMN